MFKFFALLCLTLKAAGTAPHCLAFRTHRLMAAYWAIIRELKGLAVCWPSVFHHVCDLWDNISCPLQKDVVTNADIFAHDLILIMQGCVGHNHTAYAYRNKTGNRGQCARTANLYINILQNGCGLFRGEFMCNCPARNATKLSQPVLPIIAVNLIYHPVNIIIKLVPLRCDRIIMEQQPLNAGAGLGQRIYRKPPFAQQVQKC